MRDKISERAIAKRTGLSRNTVHKWLQTPEEVEAPKYEQSNKVYLPPMNFALSSSFAFRQINADR